MTWKKTRTMTKMGKTSLTDIATIGAIGLVAYFILKASGGLKGITDAMKAAPEAAQGVTDAAQTVVAIPYNVGQTIGGELGTAAGLYANAWNDLYKTFGELITGQLGVKEKLSQDTQNAFTAAQVAPKETVTLPSGSKGNVLSTTAEREYIRARLVEMDNDLATGRMDRNVYDSVRANLLSRSAAAGLDVPEHPAPKQSAVPLWQTAATAITMSNPQLMGLSWLANLGISGVQNILTNNQMQDAAIAQANNQKVQAQRVAEESRAKQVIANQTGQSQSLSNGGLVHPSQESIQARQQETAAKQGMQGAGSIPADLGKLRGDMTASQWSDYLASRGYAWAR